MTLQTIPLSLEKVTTSTVVVPYTIAHVPQLQKLFAPLLGNIWETAISAEELQGKVNQIFFTRVPNHQTITSVVFVGLGEEMTQPIFQQALATAMIVVQKKKITDVTVWLDKSLGTAVPLAEQVRLTAIASKNTTYRFQEFFSKQDAKLVSLKTVAIASSGNSAVVKKSFDKGMTVADALIATRDLGNQPGGHVTPKILVQRAKELFKGLPVKITVLGEKEMKAKGMGAILGVSQGSQEEAQMLVMEYGDMKKNPLALVGKGITFDSGGISIKPSNAMEEMKFDMLGAATVIGSLLVAARLGLKQNIVGICACAENLPSGTAIRPGDILTAMNGTTIEVINTDAEGRLVLADALCLAREYKPKQIIDFATLTGACVAALGSVHAGLFTNSPKVREKLMVASAASGDKLWELPMTPEYREHIKSHVADIKNVGQRGEAGATAGAIFLKEFVGDVPWAHIDIAGVAWRMHDTSFAHSGATGFGVSLMVNYLP